MPGPGAGRDPHLRSGLPRLQAHGSIQIALDAWPSVGPAGGDRAGGVKHRYGQAEPRLGPRSPGVRLTMGVCPRTVGGREGARDCSCFGPWGCQELASSLRGHRGHSPASGLPGRIRARGPGLGLISSWGVGGRAVSLTGGSPGLRLSRCLAAPRWPAADGGLYPQTRDPQGPVDPTHLLLGPRLPPRLWVGAWREP